MNPRSNNPDHHQDEQRQQWDRVADAWKQWWPVIENGARGVSERMLELARIGPGQRVLDIATGIGEPALLAARRVGPAGQVVATDLSARMLDIARERAQALGLTNVAFIEADAERLDFPDGGFDAIVWRWGPSDLSNPSDALATIRRLLRPAGAFAAAVWEAGPRARPLASLANDVARDMFALPSDCAAEPTPPTESLESRMRGAGFSKVRAEEVALSLEFASADDCTRYLVEVSPAFAELLSDKSPAQRVEFRHRLTERLQPYVQADGRVRIADVTVCVVGQA